MAAEAFVNFCQNSVDKHNNVNLQEFLHNFFKNRTPTKSFLAYNLNEKEFFIKAKECILNNLYVNPHFVSGKFNVSFLNQMVDLFSQTIDSITQDHIARIIFLLHFSKSKIKTFMDFIMVVKEINSIKILSNFVYSDDLSKIYSKALTNNHFKKKIQQVIKSILGVESKYKFEQTKVIYFSCCFQGLNGFAGLDAIYLNADMLLCLHDFSNKQYSDDDKLILMKMNFIRIILHETTHVAIRFTKKDFNTSSPTEKQINLPTSYDSSINYEAGVLVEMSIFNGRIDWIRSSLKVFDLQFCRIFLQKIESNDIPELNITLPELVFRTDPILMMGIDIDFSLNNIPIYE